MVAREHIPHEQRLVMRWHYARRWEHRFLRRAWRGHASSQFWRRLTNKRRRMYERRLIAELLREGC